MSKEVIMVRADKTEEKLHIIEEGEHHPFGPDNQWIRVKAPGKPLDKWQATFGLGIQSLEDTMRNLIKGIPGWLVSVAEKRLLNQMLAEAARKAMSDDDEDD